MTIAWRDWGPEAFEEAQKTGRPVFLYLAPGWSAAGRAVLAGAEADAELAAALGRDYVAVKVDPERRPVLAALYAEGEWPTACALSPRGDVFASSVCRASDCLRAFLEKSAARWKADPAGHERGLLAARAAELERERLREMSDKLDPDFPKRTLEALLAGLDPVHGGWGAGPKEPRPSSLDLLLYAAKDWGRADARDALALTLRAMAAGELYDRQDGGFYRSAAKADWSEPEHVKLLSDNARLGRLYLDAFLLTGEPLFKQVAEQTLAWLKLALHHPGSGAFLAAQSSDRAYARMPASQRLAAPPPRVEELILADANAMAVPLLLKAACVLDGRREELEAMAVRVLKVLETQLFDHNSGVRHWMEPAEAPQQPGLLGDLAWTMIAFTEAYQYFMDRDYRDFADELLRLALRSQWYRDKGGFLDRETSPDDLGRLLLPRAGAEGNAAAFESLWRLHQMKGVANYSRWLELGFQSLLPRVEGRPHEAAPFARLLDTYFKGRMELDLIGQPEDPRTREILAQLKRHYLPRAVVSFIDVDDMDFILSHRLSAPRYPRLFVIVNGRPAASGDRPDEIEAALKHAT